MDFDREAEDTPFALVMTTGFAAATQVSICFSLERMHTYPEARKKRWQAIEIMRDDHVFDFADVDKI